MTERVNAVLYQQPDEEITLDQLRWALTRIAVSAPLAVWAVRRICRTFGVAEPSRRDALLTSMAVNYFIGRATLKPPLPRGQTVRRWIEKKERKAAAR